MAPENPPRGDVSAPSPPESANPVPTTPPAPEGRTGSLLVFEREGSRETFTSPFPPPDLLAGYQKVMPDLAERTIALLEGQNKHRQALEKKQQEAEIKDFEERRAADMEDMRAERQERRLGQLLGFALGSLALTAAVIAAGMGQPLTGGLIGGSGVAGLVAAFAFSRMRQNKPGVPPGGEK